MFKWFRKLFAKKGEVNLKAILTKLLKGETLSDEEKTAAEKYANEESSESNQPNDTEASDPPGGDNSGDDNQSNEDPTVQNTVEEENPVNDVQPGAQTDETSATDPQNPTVEVPPVIPNAPNPAMDEQVARLSSLITDLTTRLDETVNTLRKEVEDVRLLVVDQTKKPIEVERTPEAPQYKKGFFDF